MPLREQSEWTEIQREINILRPLYRHLARIVQRWSIPFLLLGTIVLVFYLLCLKFSFLNYFISVLSQGGLLLGGRALSFFLIPLGCSGGLTFTIVFAVRALLTPFLGNMVLPAGADSEASTSFPKLEWERALSLPDNLAAPEPLRSHIEEELRVLFNIGKKHSLSDSVVNNYIKPLGLDKASVGFCKALLERVDSLQLQHYNKGEHIPFLFKTAQDRARLYSIMWEYAPKSES